MEQFEADGFLDVVEAMYNRSFNPGARKSLVSSLQNECINGAMSSIKVLEDKHGLLPTPVILIKIVRDCGARIREKESAQRKRELPEKIPENNNREDNDIKYVRRSIALANAIGSGKLTRGQLLDGFRTMESCYPGRGWSMQGSILERMYKSGNLDLNKTPVNSINKQL